MLKLMLTQTKTTNMVRQSKHVRKARKQHNNKAKEHNNGGSVLTAMGFLNLIPSFAKIDTPLSPLSYSNLMERNSGAYDSSRPFEFTSPAAAPMEAAESALL